jgi:hypothetical protein
MLDDITEVSDDLLENSVMSDHSNDTTVIMCCFGIDVKTRIAKTIGWKKSLCS